MTSALLSLPILAQAIQLTDPLSAAVVAAEEPGRIVYEFARLRDFDDLRFPLAVMAAAGAALVAVVWYLYRRDTVELSKWVGAGLATLRSVAFVGLFIFFLGIERRTTHEVVHNSQVALLVDVSQSMGLSGEEAPPSSSSLQPSRLDLLANILQLSPLVPALREAHDVNVARFDREAEPIISLSMAENKNRSLNNDDQNAEGVPSGNDSQLNSEQPTFDWAAVLQPRGTQTRLGQVLTEQVRLYHSAPLAAIVVFTDGAQNAGIEPSAGIAAAQEAGIPIYTIGIGSSEPQRNIALRDLVVPARAFPGDLLNVTGYVQGHGYEGRMIDVRLLRRRSTDPADAGAVIASEQIAVGADGEIVAVSFDLEPEEAGSFVYQLRAIGPADDGNLRDNQREAEVDVVDRQTRVLLFAGGPSRDYHFLRDQLKRDKSMTVDVLLQTAQPGISQDANEILDSFPTTREELFEYDCIVAFDPNWTELDAGQVELLESWISEEAGGMIAVAGPIHTSRWTRSTEHSKLRDLYPVVFQQRMTLLDDGQFNGEIAWPLAFERSGREAKFLWIEKTADESETAWDDFPGVFGYYGVKGEKPGAAVYARFSDPEAGLGNQRPVYIASHFYGGGQVLYIGSGELWRLRSLDPAYFEVLYTKLIRQVSQGRVLRGSTRGSLLVERDRFELGENVVVRARLSDSRHKPLMEDHVNAQIVRPDGVVQQLKLTADANRPGMYLGQAKVLQEGTYQIALPLSDEIEEPLSRFIQVRVPDLERTRAERNDELLTSLAKDTGGVYYQSLLSAAYGDDQIEPLATLIESRAETMFIKGAPDEQFARWQMQWLLGVIAGSLFIEWIIRRLSRLA